MKISSLSRHCYFFIPQSFFSVWAIMRMGGFSTRSILTPVLFLFCTVFFHYASRIAGKENSSPAPVMSPRRIRGAALALALVFTLFSLLAESSEMTAGLDNRLFQLVILAACAAGLFFLFYYTMLLLFSLAGSFTLKEEKSPSAFLPCACFFFCLICWLPFFLYEYPGIMSPDSINQFEQVLGMVPYSNHHPWVHTLLIGLLYRFGRLFTRDISAALSFFTVFQMLFMAGAASWLVSTLMKLKVKKQICLLIIAFYALVPYHAVFAVTIWKDVLFAGVILLFTTALARILFLFGEFKKGEKAVTLIIYALSGMLMCLFRTNGFYAFLLTFPFLLYVFRRSLKLMLPLQLGMLLLVLLIKGPVMDACHVTQPDFVESICIPLQQVSRVICEEKELTEEEWTLVHQVMDTTYIRELYAPGFADNMKELVRAGNPDYLAAHKGEYLKLWLKLGLRYPASYIGAYVDQTIGYWYPDVAYAVGEIDGVIENQTGVSSRPLIGGPIIVKAKEILLKLGDILPLYGLLSSMGAMFWTLLCAIAITYIKKQRSRYILFLPGLAIILTLFLATPVSSEFRYAYSLAYTLPLYLVLPFLPIRKSDYSTFDKKSCKR